MPCLYNSVCYVFELGLRIDSIFISYLFVSSGKYYKALFFGVATLLVYRYFHEHVLFGASSKYLICTSL